MDRISEISRQISILIPKLMRSVRSGLITRREITSSQLIVLLTILETGSIQASELSRKLGVSAPTITGIIDRLVRAGYILRAHGQKDRRVVNIQITPKGRKEAEVFLKSIQRRWKSILIHLTAQEREVYLKILNRILEVVSGEDA